MIDNQNRSSSNRKLTVVRAITQVNILSTLEHQKRIGYTKVFEVADYDERAS